MNFNFILAESNVPWVNEYKALYFRELTKLGHTCNSIQYESLSDLNGDNWVIFGHWKEYQNSLRYKKSYRSIMQSNGTSANPFIYQVDPNQELIDLSSVDVNLTAHPSHTKAIADKFRVSNVYTAGFPVEIPTLPIRKKKNTFVIAGRLSPDKNIYLAVFALLKYCKYEKITICYQHYTSSELKNYPIESWKDLNIEFKQCDRLEYLNILAESEYYVNFSLGDTSSVSAIESFLCGCYPLLMDFGSEIMIPYYSKFIDYPIPINAIAAIKWITEMKPEQNIKADLFNPLICAQTLVRICESW